MSRYIPVITKEYSRKISVDDIIYLEQRQRKLAIVTDDETYVCYHTLKKLVVNLEKVSVMRDQKVIFQNGSILMLARESYIRTKQIYTAYLRDLLR